MTPYVGCDYAQERLESLVDGELSIEEQVLVEAHVRWCRTCAARIEDMRLIGESIRTGSPALRLVCGAEPALQAVYSGVILRARAEREQSLAVRFRELLTDTHLLWPALGATLAVVICAAMATSVLRITSVERPESLATRLEAMTNPGSELNPLRPDNNSRVDRYFSKFVDSDRAGGISVPRVVDNGASFESLSDEEGMFTMATVVSREGRIANAEVLQSQHTGSRAEDVEAVLDAVRQSRFAPAQTSLGRAVAVNMVWVIVVTTVQEPGPETGTELSRVEPRPRRLPAADTAPSPATGRQSSRISSSPTA